MSIGIIGIFDDKLIVPKTMTSRTNQNTNQTCMRQTEHGLLITPSINYLSYYDELTGGFLEQNAALKTDRIFALVLPDNKLYVRTCFADANGIREFFQIYRFGEGTRMVFAGCEDRTRTGDVMIQEARTPSEFIKAFNNMFPHVSDYYILDAKKMSEKQKQKPAPLPACMVSIKKIHNARKQ